MLAGCILDLEQTPFKEEVKCALIILSPGDREFIHFHLDCMMLKFLKSVVRFVNSLTVWKLIKETCGGRKFFLTQTRVCKLGKTKVCFLSYPNQHLFKVDHGNIRTLCEISSKLTIKSTTSFWCLSC